MRNPPADVALEAAESASEGLRALNHATINTAGAAEDFWPSDVYAIVGELAFLTHRFPQALNQLTAIIGELQATDRLAHDEGTVVDTEFVASIADHLATAGERATATAEALDQAHAILAHLKCDDPEDAS